MKYNRTKWVGLLFDSVMTGEWGINARVVLAEAQRLVRRSSYDTGGAFQFAGSARIVRIVVPRVAIDGRSRGKYVAEFTR